MGGGGWANPPVPLPPPTQRGALCDVPMLGQKLAILDPFPPDGRGLLSGNCSVILGGGRVLLGACEIC